VTRMAKLKPKTIKPSDLKREAERLIQAGEMPTLDELLDAVEAVRERYRAQILRARKESKITSS
jgi:hypothetical protein